MTRKVCPRILRFTAGTDNDYGMNFRYGTTCEIEGYLIPKSLLLHQCPRASSRSAPVYTPFPFYSTTSQVPTSNLLQCNSSIIIDYLERVIVKDPGIRHVEPVVPVVPLAKKLRLVARILEALIDEWLLVPMQMLGWGRVTDGLTDEPMHSTYGALY